MSPVAPHAGAWIETIQVVSAGNQVMSRPTRARGLKRQALAGGGVGSGVAPHAGAWIETWKGRSMKPLGVWSRPTRARGLKHAHVKGRNRILASRPTRARGLKPDISAENDGKIGVAPHAGAWIETLPPGCPWRATPVAPHAGAWIETRTAGAMD